MKIKYILTIILVIISLWSCNNDSPNITPKEEKSERVVWKKIKLNGLVDAYEYNGLCYIPWPEEIVKLNSTEVIKKSKTKNGGHNVVREHRTGNLTLFDNGHVITLGTIDGILRATISDNGLCLNVDTKLGTRFNAASGLPVFAKYIDNNSVASWVDPTSVMCKLVGQVVLQGSATFNYPIPLANIPGEDFIYWERFYDNGSGNNGTGNSGTGNSGTGNTGTGNPNDFNGYPDGGKIVEAYYDTECRDLIGTMHLWFAASIGAKSYIDTSWPGVCHKIQ